jgi:hypothetical protein
MKPEVESIYCDDCGEVRPVTRDFMAGGTLNDHDSTDLLCDRYHIVATLHHPTHTPNPDFEKALAQYPQVAGKSET